MLEIDWLVSGAFEFGLSLSSHHGKVVESFNVVAPIGQIPILWVVG